jgi:hypothetical protein
MLFSLRALAALLGLGHQEAPAPLGCLTNAEIDALD